MRWRRWNSEWRAGEYNGSRRGLAVATTAGYLLLIFIPGKDTEGGPLFASAKLVVLGRPLIVAPREGHISRRSPRQLRRANTWGYLGVDILIFRGRGLPRDAPRGTEGRSLLIGRRGSAPSTPSLHALAPHSPPSSRPYFTLAAALNAASTSPPASASRR
ncbi:hypothetical protein E2C01_061368 [Portunus trituberculatus]|uniref:Uncharacterized protein n=1 Tax=Portunus trituberculatus TaxID=210409 RepID=A0A5B7H3N9_PORTR|nr:hypothetical protein [Portunus trituberculatus]